MRKQIPWTFVENDRVKLWVWKTKDFEVQIFAEGETNSKKNFAWKITDKTQGRDIPFDSAIASTFQECVDAVLELIGKSYKPILGYQAYAGELATTFTIATGQRLDFAPLVGEKMIVKVLEDDGSEKVVVGALQIENYSVQIRTDDNNATVFPPERIKDLQKEFAGVSVLTSLDQTKSSSKMKRVFHTEYTRGCTGQPGFKPGTVTHSPSDPYCPIHGI